MVGLEVWDSYFKFTVVRNPYDKMVSAFFHFEKSRDPDLYLNDKKTEIERFRTWVANGASINGRSAYMIDKKMALDYVIRYESLNDGIKEVCDKLTVPLKADSIPKMEAQHRDRSLSVSEFYDVATKEK